MNVYILAKNEESNISNCITAIKDNPFIHKVVLYDSGSTDSTMDIAKSLGVQIVNYKYINHCTAYNTITSNSFVDNEPVIILDADMIVSSDLITEIITKLKNGIEVVLAPVEMYYEGYKLKFSSLYPPKPIAFNIGKEYFEPVGHGERLKNGLRIKKTKSVLIHDDKKSYERFINSQLNYAKNFIERSYSDKMTFRDKIRLRSPLGIILTPLYSYFIKLGFLDGKSGLLYALDRLIAEAIIYRQSLNNKINSKGKLKT